jgi:hypothetical protein
MRNNDRPDKPESAPAPPEPDYAIAFTPRQLAGGFAILAALLLLVLRRRRRKR